MKVFSFLLLGSGVCCFGFRDARLMLTKRSCRNPPAKVWYANSCHCQDSIVSGWIRSTGHGFWRGRTVTLESGLGKVGLPSYCLRYYNTVSTVLYGCCRNDADPGSLVGLGDLAIGDERGLDQSIT